MSDEWRVPRIVMMATAFVHSSRRPRLLRMTADAWKKHRLFGDWFGGWQPGWKRARIKARRLLAERYGEDHYGWDGE